MKYNRDGTLYKLGTILEAIDSRCNRAEFPNLSDLLGSDWDLGREYGYTPESYKARAVNVAKQIYKD